jgi:hypothetical protein
VTEPGGAVRALGEGSQVRLRLWAVPSQELAWLDGDVPRWVRRLWQTRHPDREEVTLADRLAALSAILQHRLDSLSFLVERLAEMGWSVLAEGDTLRARSALSPEEAERQLDQAGVLILVRLHAVDGGQAGVISGRPSGRPESS